MDSPTNSLVFEPRGTRSFATNYESLSSSLKSDTRSSNFRDSSFLLSEASLFESVASSFLSPSPSLSLVVSSFVELPRPRRVLQTSLYVFQGTKTHVRSTGLFCVATSREA